MMIGHEDALREWCGDDVGWHYQDERNRVLASVLEIFHGVKLRLLDEFIEQLEAEGAGAGAELRDRRTHALRLFWNERSRYDPDKFHDFAWCGHIDWILLRKRQIKKGDSQAKALQAGLSTIKGGKKGAEASRKTRNGASSKKAAIIQAAEKYEGSDKARISTIARNTKSTPQYVRKVLKNKKP